jgi:hypothetical protein
MGEPRAQQKHLLEALELEGLGYRLLLRGDRDAAGTALGRASAAYRRSWEAAPPRAFGRLVGMLKTAILSGGETEAAAYAERELGGGADSPASSYALALAALASGADEAAARAARGMPEGGEAFARAAAAIEALAAGDRAGYRRALGEIVADFEGRDEHLTDVAIADTALVLERLARRRGISAGVTSPMLPAQ